MGPPRAKPVWRSAPLVQMESAAILVPLAILRSIPESAFNVTPTSMQIQSRKPASNVEMPVSLALPPQPIPATRASRMQPLPTVLAPVTPRSSTTLEPILVTPA